MWSIRAEVYILHHFLHRAPSYAHLYFYSIFICGACVHAYFCNPTVHIHISTTSSYVVHVCSIFFIMHPSVHIHISGSSPSSCTFIFMQHLLHHAHLYLCNTFLIDKSKIKKSINKWNWFETGERRRECFLVVRRATVHRGGGGCYGGHVCLFKTYDWIGR